MISGLQKKSGMALIVYSYIYLFEKLEHLCYTTIRYSIHGRASSIRDHRPLRTSHGIVVWSFGKGGGFMFDLFFSSQFSSSNQLSKHGTSGTEKTAFSKAEQRSVGWCRVFGLFGTFSKKFAETAFDGSLYGKPA